MKSLILITSILFSFSTFASIFKLEVKSSWLSNEHVELRAIEIIEAKSGKFIYLSPEIGSPIHFKLKLDFKDIGKKLINLKINGFEYRNNEEFIFNRFDLVFNEMSNAMISTENGGYGVYKMKIRVLDIIED